MHLITSITPGLGAGGRRLRAGCPEGAMGGDPRWLLMERCISIACSRLPLRLLGVGAAGIRSRWLWKASGSMDSGRAAVLLVVLLLADWGLAKGPGGQDEDQIFMVSTPPLYPHFPLPQFRLLLRFRYPQTAKVLVLPVGGNGSSSVSNNLSPAFTPFPL